MKANENGDGTVTFQELSDYVKSNIKPLFVKMTVKSYSSSPSLPLFGYSISLDKTKATMYQKQSAQLDGGYHL